MGLFIKPKSGIDFSKLNPCEALFYAITLQAVKDIATTKWGDGQAYCSIKEGLEAVDFIETELHEMGYSKGEIGAIFKTIVPKNYKFELIKERLKKRGIEL